MGKTTKLFLLDSLLQERQDGSHAGQQAEDREEEDQEVHEAPVGPVRQAEEELEGPRVLTTGCAASSRGCTRCPTSGTARPPPPGTCCPPASRRCSCTT